MRRTVGEFWSRLRGAPALVWVGIVGIATSIIILAFSAGPNLVDVARIAGTALFAASLSIVFAAISAREAARQQYARDAHLQAKDKIYLPLNAQLASAHEELKRIKAGDAPYMQGVVLEEHETSPSGLSHQFTPGKVELWRWHGYVRDNLRAEFSNETASRLDSVVRAAEQYNAAIEAAREPTYKRLDVNIKLARGLILKPANENESMTMRYRAWQREVEERQRNPASGHTLPQDAWFQVLQSGSDVDLLAKEWICGFNLAHPPDTLGWLVAGYPHLAAHAVRAMYTGGAAAGSSQLSTIDVDWVASIFTGTLPYLEADADYDTVRRQFAVLLQEVEAAHSRLEAGLKKIRDLYQGGDSFV